MVKIIVGKPGKVEGQDEVWRLWVDDEEDPDHPYINLHPEGVEPGRDNMIITFDPEDKEITVYKGDIKSLGWTLKIVG